MLTTIQTILVGIAIVAGYLGGTTHVLVLEAFALILGLGVIAQIAARSHR